MAKKWNIDSASIKNEQCVKVCARLDRAKVQMQMRTRHHELYGLLAKNKSIHEWNVKRGRTQYFSEGSTQHILRKVLADTIQRVPDGELCTPYDRDSVEHILTRFVFENKVMWSEMEGIDMMSNLTNAFKMSFIYAFAPVRIGFEKDADDTPRISFNLEQWSDVFVNEDCSDIRSPNVVYHRQYLGKDDVKALINEETGECYDSTYSADTVKYILDNGLFGGSEMESEKLHDQLKGSTRVRSVELITEYRKGADEFVTYCPACNAVFRRVKNYDPRKSIPWVFLVLEPDPDSAIGVSQVEFLLADQQFNDLFQTSAYKNLLLAMEPPIMVSGWETNPSSYRFAPRAIWNLGNNPNQVKVEPVKVDNSILGNWTQTREAVASSMLRSLNVADGTVAMDAGAGYSKTAPGVDAQTRQKTININQYQKRVEFFVAEYARIALRMYIAALGGVHKMTVDEDTRRRLFDIGREDLIDGTNVNVDFDLLGTDLLEFKVRAGSLIEKKEDQEREALTTMMQPFIQNLNSWSDENRPIVETQIILPIMRRMVELCDTDLSSELSDTLTNRIVESMMSDMRQQLSGQQQQLDAQGAAIEGLAAQQQGMSPDMAQAQQQAQMLSGGATLTMPQTASMPPMQPQDMGQIPVLPPSDDVESMSIQDETPGQQVNKYEGLIF